MQLYSFSDAELLNGDLASQIKNILCEAVSLRGIAYLVVSGGKTPIALFKILSKTCLPWEKVQIILADERCVSSEHKDSNAGLVKEYLLQHEAQKAHLMSLYEEGMNLSLKEASIAALPLFDAVILGMGEDGHTASLFPCSDELETCLDDEAKALHLVQPKSAPYQRITLSKKRLLESRIIFLHILGKKKRMVLSQALAQKDPRVMPVSAFLNHQEANVQVMYAPD